MKNVILKKQDGVISTEDYDISKIKEIKSNYSSPCFDCKNGYASKCQKMFDCGAKDIKDYDFIDSGIQSYDENGISNLYVMNCTNYEKDAPRKPATTKEEIERLKYLKESIKILYFSAETVEEANRTQHDLMRRGLLIPYSSSSKSR